MSNKLGIHETLELHELLTFKTVCVTKSSTMMGLVSDRDLKNLIKEDIKLSKQHMSDLQALLQHTLH